MKHMAEAEIARLRADRDRCKAAAISIEHDVCYIIGEALYGPDGWGDHVAQTLAQEAVNEIARLRTEAEAAWKCAKAEAAEMDRLREALEKVHNLGIDEDPTNITSDALWPVVEEPK